MDLWRKLKSTIWVGLIAHGVNQKVFLGGQMNLKKASAAEFTKPLRSSSCGLINLIFAGVMDKFTYCTLKHS